MGRILKNLISVAWSLLRFSIMKLFFGSHLSFHAVERISPNVIVSVSRSSKLVLGNRVRVHHGTKLSAASDGILCLGDNVAINQNCGIFAMERIEIGAGTEFGPGVLVYDHDHDFRCAGGLKAGKFKTAPVLIGKNVWVGANSIILRGTSIGDNAVIGAGCIIKGDIPADCVVTQKRETTIREIHPETNEVQA